MLKKISDDFYKTTVMNVAKQKQVIRSATIEILDYCNYKCKHCYVRNSYKKIMSKNDFFWVIDELHKEKCLWLLITGGEIFLHPNFKEMYTYAYNKGFIITLFTNGYYFDDSLIELFSKLPPNEIEITLYGDSNSYDGYVGVDGAFDRLDINIKKLCKTNLPLKLKTILCVDLYNSYSKMLEYSQKYNLPLRIDGHILPKINGENVEKMRLDPNIVIMEENSISLDLKKSAIDKLKHYEYNNALYTCSAGENSIFIDANLNACLCMMARHICVSLRKDNVSLKIAQKIIVDKKNKKAKLNKSNKCYNCKYRPLCRYCPGQFIIEKGDEYSPIEWYCRYAKQFFKFITKGE